MARSIPQIVEKIKSIPHREIDYSFQKNVSVSQMSMYSSCPKKWSLQYKEGHKSFTSNIHTVFGTALHETIQYYLNLMYNESSIEADSFDIEDYFETSFRENYTKQYEKNKSQHFSNAEEMSEFFEDGIAILKFIKDKRREYFVKKDHYLVGVEIPLVVVPNPKYPNVVFGGFIDLVLYCESTDTFIIYDIKTSSRGWNEKDKKDIDKQNQLLLYKSIFSEQFGISEDKIDIKFFILKRKIWEQSIFSKRIQEFSPISGKNKLKKSRQSLETFIEKIFNYDGSYKNVEHKPTPDPKTCKYCMFNKKPELCDKGKKAKSKFKFEY